MELEDSDRLPLVGPLAAAAGRTGPAPPLSVPRRRCRYRAAAGRSCAAFRGPCAALARSLRRHPRGRIAPSQLEGYPSRRPPPHPLRNLHRRWLGPPPPPPLLGPTPPPLVAQASAFLSFCEGCEVDIRLFFEKAGKILMGQALLGP
ncbi:hypothetical protein Scep_014317 [Stephania cephalantha]|uniref:Uncharacterized protein n=1 Tax=Stephania cephalantha TaxID=152367 RepID=A0AAP0P2W3_9MAGN